MSSIQHRYQKKREISGFFTSVRFLFSSTTRANRSSVTIIRTHADLVTHMMTNMPRDQLPTLYKLFSTRTTIGTHKIRHIFFLFFPPKQALKLHQQKCPSNHGIQKTVWWTEEERGKKSLLQNSLCDARLMCVVKRWSTKVLLWIGRMYADDTTPKKFSEIRRASERTTAKDHDECCHL